MTLLKAFMTVVRISEKYSRRSTRVFHGRGRYGGGKPRRDFRRFRHFRTFLPLKGGLCCVFMPFLTLMHHLEPVPSQNEAYLQILQKFPRKIAKKCLFLAFRMGAWGLDEGNKPENRPDGGRRPPCPPPSWQTLV